MAPGVTGMTRNGGKFPAPSRAVVVVLAWAAVGAVPVPEDPAAPRSPADHAEKMARGLEMHRKDVAPLLREHCVKCHGGEKTKADFDLTTREGLLIGGAEGPAIKPFDSGASWLMKLIRHEEEPEMPEKKPKLPDDAIAKIAAWIDHGAPYDSPLIAGKAPPRDKSRVTDDDRRRSGPSGRWRPASRRRSQDEAWCAHADRSLHPGGAGGEGPRRRPRRPIAAR